MLACVLQATLFIQTFYTQTLNKPLNIKIARVARQAQLGFTLIEVMVGVAIFAVLSALIVGSIQSNGDRNAKLEAQRFIAVVNEVRDEALISGKTFTLLVNEKGKQYSFQVLGATGHSVPDSLLRARNLHRSVKLKWEVFEEFNQDDDEDIDDLEQEQSVDESVSSNSSSSNSGASIEPKVYITALGEITPFQVRFGGDDDDFIVQLNDEGVLEYDVKASNFF